MIADFWREQKEQQCSPADVATAVAAQTVTGNQARRNLRLFGSTHDKKGIATS